MWRPRDGTTRKINGGYECRRVLRKRHVSLVHMAWRKRWNCWKTPRAFSEATVIEIEEEVVNLGQESSLRVFL